MIALVVGIVIVVGVVAAIGWWAGGGWQGVRDLFVGCAVVGLLAFGILLVGVGLRQMR